MAAVALPDWKKLLRTARQHRDRAALERRYLYILPTRAGMLFAIILLGMLLGAINYSLGLGFVLVFWLGGVGVVAMLHTWRNLAHLAFTAGRMTPVFAGEIAHFNLVAHDPDHRPRYAIALCRGQEAPVYADIVAGGKAEFSLAIASQSRGWLKPGRITAFTEYPLGLFHAWGYIELDAACLVYPRPAPPGSPLPAYSLEARPQGRHTAGGDEDFCGLRAYKTGDSMRRIDWKASSREQGLYTKEFQGQGQQLLWLAWDMTAGDTEVRLSLLTRWVLDAHEAGCAWGLRLPGQEIRPASGEVQLRACLQALALFGA